MGGFLAPRVSCGWQSLVADVDRESSAAAVPGTVEAKAPTTEAERRLVGPVCRTVVQPVVERVVVQVIVQPRVTPKTHRVTVSTAMGQLAVKRIVLQVAVQPTVAVAVPVPSLSRGGTRRENRQHSQCRHD